MHPTDSFFGIHIHDNVFTVENTGDPDDHIGAAALRIDGVAGTENVLFEYNTLVSNSRWIITRSTRGFEFRSNTFVIGENPSEPLEPFTSYYFDQDEWANLKFVDNRYAERCGRFTGKKRDLCGCVRIVIGCNGRAVCCRQRQCNVLITGGR